MDKRVSIIILIIITTIFVIGCSQEDENLKIEEFSISYLDIQDNKLIVDSEVPIHVEVPKADRVELNIQEYGQEKVEDIVDGEKSGNQWSFVYKNTDPFMKEIWVVAYYNEEQISSDKKVITNQTQTYESAFESIIPVSSEESDSINLSKQEVNLTVLGWLDNQSILAQENNQLLTYHYSDGVKNILHENAWNIYPSPNMKKVIFQDSEGMHVADTKLENKKEIFEPNDNQIIKDLTWSRDQKDIIVHIVENEEDLFYFVDTEKNNSKKVNINKEEYTLEDLIYLDNDYLFVLGNMKGENENTKDVETSTELLGININTGKIKYYTPNLQTMDEIKILGQVNDKEFLMRVTTQEVSEEEIINETNIYLLNTQNRIMKNIKVDIDFPYVYHLSPHKDFYMYLKNPKENDSSNEKRIVLGEDKGKEIEILKAVQYYPNAFYWSPNGQRILFYIANTKELYCIEKKG